MNVSAHRVGDTPRLSAPSVASTGNWEDLCGPAVQSRRAQMAQGGCCAELGRASSCVAFLATGGSLRHVCWMPRGMQARQQSRIQGVRGM